MAKLNRKIGEEGFDGLISQLNPPVQVRARTIRKLAAAATLKRGTIMAMSSVDGKLVILGSVASSTSAEQKFNGDGTATVFTVTAKPTTLTGVKVGGVASTDWTYDASTGKITFGTAPAAGTNNVVATYVASAEELVPDCILADDVEVGTAADVNVAAYTAGCFDFGHCIVAEDYTVTAADYDALRVRDIVFHNSID